MKWFGVDWGAKVYKSVKQAPAPLGEPCVRCDKAIVAGDKGLLIPSNEGHVAYHLHCFLDTVGLGATNEPLPPA